MNTVLPVQGQVQIGPLHVGHVLRIHDGHYMVIAPRLGEVNLLDLKTGRSILDPIEVPSAKLSLNYDLAEKMAPSIIQFLRSSAGSRYEQLGYCVIRIEGKPQ